jgi:hypothetical protein
MLHLRRELPENSSPVMILNQRMFAPQAAVQEVGLERALMIRIWVRKAEVEKAKAGKTEARKALEEKVAAISRGGRGTHEKIVGTRVVSRVLAQRSAGGPLKKVVPIVGDGEISLEAITISRLE